MGNVFCKAVTKIISNPRQKLHDTRCTQIGLCGNLIHEWSFTALLKTYLCGTPIKLHLNTYTNGSHITAAAMAVMTLSNDDVIKWKHFTRYWSFVRGIHRSPVNSPHKGQWRWALMFSLISAQINGWVNNREAGDLRHHRAHYDVIIMGSGGDCGCGGGGGGGDRWCCCCCWWWW